MTRTMRFFLDDTALIAGVLPTFAAGLGWKVLSLQSVKEPEVCFHGFANVFRADGRSSVWTKCLAKKDLKQCSERILPVHSRISPLKKSRKIAHDYVPQLQGLRPRG